MIVVLWLALIREIVRGEGRTQEKERERERERREKTVVYSNKSVNLLFMKSRDSSYGDEFMFKLIGFH